MGWILQQVNFIHLFQLLTIFRWRWREFSATTALVRAPEHQTEIGFAPMAPAAGPAFNLTHQFEPGVLHLLGEAIDPDAMFVVVGRGIGPPEAP